MKLYQAPYGKIFAQRTYWNLIYEKQTRSKRWRQVCRYFDLTKKLENIETRYMKNFYRGEPTPRFVGQCKLTNKLEDMGKIALWELLRS